MSVFLLVRGEYFCKKIYGSNYVLDQKEVKLDEV